MTHGRELPARYAFVIGAPRSGTSWLQFMLGSHPDVVTPQELDLFSRYIPPLVGAWEHEMQRDPSDRLSGLTTALTREEFDGVLRSVVASVHRRVLDMKPEATLVLEKDPAYSLHVPLIERLLPGARYIHVIRDGRDVVASLMSAGASWGWRWAPNGARRAATMWRAHVEAATEASAFGGRYLEVRYEELLDHGAALLAEAFAFLGLDADAALCERIVDANTFTKAVESGGLSPSVAFGGEALRRFGRATEPKGFFRSGRAGGWPAVLSARDVGVCDATFGDLLVSLGYTPSAPALATSLTRVQLKIGEGARSGARLLSERLERWGRQ